MVGGLQAASGIFLENICSVCRTVGMKLIISLLAFALASTACAWDAEGNKWVCSATEAAPEGVYRCGPPLVPLVSSNGVPYCGQRQACEEKKQTHALWKWSAVAASAGVGMDIASSYRVPVELNPMYRSADGRFSHRGFAIRGGMAAGTLALQWLVMRTHPPVWVERTFAIVNFAAGANSARQAVKNWQLR